MILKEKQNTFGSPINAATFLNLALFPPEMSMAWLYLPSKLDWHTYCKHIYMQVNLIEFNGIKTSMLRILASYLHLKFDSYHS